MTDGWRQCPLSGHAFVLSAVLLFFMWSAGILVCPDEFKMRLLWLSMICFVLFLQL